MELFTQEIIDQLKAQYVKAGDLESQQVICKIFNPYGMGTWYCLNMDPDDGDYIWCIASMFEVEVGSVLRSELESITFEEHGMQLERDLYFKPINAQEAYERLLKGEHL